ncbi:thymic stromal cotransporter homolog isoform X1 [Apis dorsata]|uniref:thymic stromal cotransporter homolog isoform X1 n=1 Tax=Apis dorsata TaxID=7462 RepID=UPI0003DF7E50|nr:thymic stromal cotransporter homolog isoform X1 [Apis dorsata]XP_031369852.1 thymic stromal cotransporter homolog isoform X1 [Apis dorsata]
MENELRLNENETDKKWKKFFEWIKNVSVEPTMWLFMMAFMITSVVEQAFFVYKSCRVDHGYSEKICSNLNDNETIKTAVQLTVSNFHQWNNIAGHIVPIILAFFYGNWSDRRGRKLPLIMGLLGKFIYSFMIVINSMMDTWNLNTVVYFATLPMGMLGGDVVIFGSCFAYISDISSIQQRTLRITILDVIYLSTMPTGVALGSYIYTNVVNKSYTIMFIINASLLFLAILYSLIKLKWQTLPQQQVLMGTNLLTDFFDKKHIIATIKTVIKTRPDHGKLHLLFLLIIMMLYVFQRDEKPMSFLYAQLKFKWDVNTYSNFRTFQSSTFVLAMLIGVPIMSKLMKIRDTIIVAIGAIAHASGRIIFALAKIPELFYVGAGVAALGPIVAPVLRSMTSKLVTIEERGKIFAILSVCDNAVPLFSSILYSQLYNATINSAPSSIYWLTFITQIFVLFLILIIHFSIKNRSDQYVDDDIVDNEINN